MANYRYKISLRLWHPSFEPQTATDRFCLTPTRAWRAEDRRLSPEGEPLEGVHRESYWTAVAAHGESKDASLPTGVATVLDSLWPQRQFLVDFVDDGGIAELFVGWFYATGNTGDSFDWRLLERLAQLRLNPSFDLYGA